jgi:branched-chain amino acid transport system substrate-binding protein
LIPEERWQTVREMREYLQSAPSTAAVKEPPKEVGPVLVSVAPIGPAEKPLFQVQQQVKPREVEATEYVPRPIRSTDSEKEPRKKSRLFPVLTGGCILVVLLISISLIGIFLAQVINYSNIPTQTVSRSSLATEPGIVLDKPTEIEPVQGPAGEPIRIGLLAPLTGSVSNFGVSVTEGVRLAVDQWNESNGVLGRRIELLVADTRCEADPAILETNRLIDQDGVKFIIGDVCSQASIPVSDIVNEKHVVQISPTSSNPMVTQNMEGRTKKFSFRTCFIDSFQGNVMARFAIEEGFKTAFIVHEPENPYSRDLAEVFKITFTELGGEVVGMAPHSFDQEDFSEILTEVANSRAQMLFVPHYYDVVNKLGRQLKDRDLKVVMMGGDGWESSELDLGAVEGGFFSTNFNPSDPNHTVRGYVRHDLQNRYRAAKSAGCDRCPGIRRCESAVPHDRDGWLR